MKLPYTLNLGVGESRLSSPWYVRKAYSPTAAPGTVKSRPSLGSNLIAAGALILFLQFSLLAESQLKEVFGHGTISH